MAPGAFKLEVYLDAADEWRWRVQAENGEIVADSAEGYTERNDAIEAYNRLEEEIVKSRHAHQMHGVPPPAAA